ncbi:PREDICTED: phosphatidylserine decarboxylase proenzyme, mitochondrial-like isoform X2 [Amphimedon queenslandica]|uniref:Phosphatidylserine decarboxylase proenzyme, mitochondrial n=1 Tax=Amphimedon queenslandica TaxID=400682 RepID=A0AAN0IZ74_AMPQE|nr:PREDICTED: phosphatidylserine decarboxylase proenzyme, mitochondrial-like isoform X2 [Amphimedon queenslandica]|eukprot:XP_019850075.1 PREDICTED: phosphatidylserine decarboxylase proenzyme, mitochondrial-like isoform X2 [Amphimedon queenslandica]
MRTLRRHLSYSLPRRAYTSYRRTINNINEQNEQFIMKLSVLLLVAGCMFAFNKQSGLAWMMDEGGFYENTLRKYSGSLTGEAVAFFFPPQSNSFSPLHNANGSSTCCRNSTKVNDNQAWVDEVKVSNPAVSSKTRESKNVFVVSAVTRQQPDVLICLRKALILAIITSIFIIFLHLQRTLNEQICLASPQKVTWQLLLFRLLPLRTLSRVNGYTARLNFPYFLRILLWSLFVWLFDVKLHEAENESLSSYKNFRSLFKRRLKPGLRPINMSSGLVSPVDGKVMYVGTLTDDYNTIEQVKGVQYSLKAFLGRGVLPRYGRSNGMVLHTAVLYLSPGDYHHFHSPADWRLHLYRHFPGELVTVSPWAVKHMPGLLALNERVLLSGQWEHGYFSLTAVGALNVGSIYIDKYEELKTNVKGHYKFNTYTDKHLGKVGDQLVRGDHIGGFNIGSTVVLIFEAPSSFQFNIKPGDSVKYGESIGTI